MADRTDIFGYRREAKPAGVFSLTGSTLNISGGGGGGFTDSPEGYLVQSWNTNYQQQVRELFEIGSDALYWAKGRPQGTGTIGRIIGSKDAFAGSEFFPKKAYDLCDGGVQITLKAKGGACENPPQNTGQKKLDKGVVIVMDGVVVTSIGFAMQITQDIQLNENFGWRFAYMEIKALDA